jgi:nucleotidyltransferase substrate binding protein (TIGR01987 family)
MSRASTVVDGTIQRFEVTFEIAWKLGKDYLDFSGIRAASPRAVIKEAFRQELITEGDPWIQMLDDRNKTSHLYDKKETLQIYRRIRKSYFPLLEAFSKKIQSRLRAS